MHVPLKITCSSCESNQRTSSENRDQCSHRNLKKVIQHSTNIPPTYIIGCVLAFYIVCVTITQSPNMSIGGRRFDIDLPFSSPRRTQFPTWWRHQNLSVQPFPLWWDGYCWVSFVYYKYHHCQQTTYYSKTYHERQMNSWKHSEFNQQITDPYG